MSTIEIWDGPVYWQEEDRFFFNTKEAINYIQDLSEDAEEEGVVLPIYLYCCDIVRAKVPVSFVMSSIVDYLDDNYPGDDYPSDVLRLDLDELEARLNPIFDEWNEKWNWFSFKLTGKKVTIEDFWSEKNEK